MLSNQKKLSNNWKKIFSHSQIIFKTKDKISINKIVIDGGKLRFYGEDTQSIYTEIKESSLKKYTKSGIFSVIQHLENQICFDIMLLQLYTQNNKKALKNVLNKLYLIITKRNMEFLLVIPRLSAEVSALKTDI